jgi:hypothetical protein
VALNPTAGPQGTEVTASGCGWTPGTQITVTWDNPQQTLATTVVDQGGGFIVSFLVPANAPPGDHQVLFTQSCPGCVMRQETALFRVTTSPPPPPPPPPPGPPPPPACNPSMPVTLTPSFGPPATFVTAQGCGWTPGSQVFGFWNNEEPVTQAVVNPDGTFTSFFLVPDDDSDEGLHEVVFIQSCGMGCVSRFAMAPFIVTE